MAGGGECTKLSSRFVHKCCQHLHIYLFSSSLASSKSSYKLLTNTSKYLKLNLTYPLYTTIHIVSTRNTSYLHHKTLDIYLIFSFPCLPSARCRFKEVMQDHARTHLDTAQSIDEFVFHHYSDRLLP